MSEVKQCAGYKRPDGIMGGPCTRCGRLMREHPVPPLGTDLAIAADPDARWHAAAMEAFQQQLVVAMLKRLQRNGRVRIPVAEVDGTGDTIVKMAVRDGDFVFVLERKQ